MKAQLSLLVLFVGLTLSQTFFSLRTPNEIEEPNKVELEKNQPSAALRLPNEPGYVCNEKVKIVLRE